MSIIPVALGHAYRIDGFGDGSDLVHFYQQRITDAFIDLLFGAGHIRYKQVVATSWHLLPMASVSIFQPFNRLRPYHLRSSRWSIASPSLPVYFTRLFAGHFLAIAFVEDVFFSLAFQSSLLAASMTILITSLFYNRPPGWLIIPFRWLLRCSGYWVRNHLHRLHWCCTLSSLIQFQRMEDLHTPLQPFAEAGCAHGHDHKFLEVDLVIGMGAHVEDVHHRDRQDPRIGFRRCSGYREGSSRAAALATAIPTANRALAPSFPLLLVPSSAIIMASIPVWSATSQPAGYRPVKYLHSLPL